MTYTSAGENWDESPECRCRATNVLYWELSEADTTDCPVHGEPDESPAVESDP
jgi:hypothetical protein